METYDVVIIGGGILGSSVAYWLSEIYDARIAILEKNPEVGREASWRNTGVLHRPFYLDPVRRRKFALAADLGYRMWSKVTQEEGLPWNPVGTLEVATTPEQITILEKYVEWGVKNGMKEEELELLRTQEQVESKQPLLECYGALLCKTDTAVDFHAFTRYMAGRASSNGVEILKGKKVVDIENKGDLLEIRIEDSEPIGVELLINCAGGNAIDIAHQCGVGLEYTDIHFRGDYWIINPEVGRFFRHNIYNVPEHPKFQFLDPHLIIRASGGYEIGPTAVPVAGPENYNTLGDLREFLSKLFERPVNNKLKLIFNPEFLRLAANELTHLSKAGMVRRMNRFIPILSSDDIIGRGNSGIRHSVIAPDGSFVPEAVELVGERSYHVFNYNSPGASGAIAYATYVVDDMHRRGIIRHPKRISQRTRLFDFDEVADQFR